MLTNRTDSFSYSYFFSSGCRTADGKCHKIDTGNEQNEEGDYTEYIRVNRIAYRGESAGKFRVKVNICQRLKVNCVLGFFIHIGA